jgi:gliding motility-associated lipoprotein GldD
MKKKLTFLFVMLVFIACQKNHTPKPRGYFRIDMPERKYVLYENKSCTFQFEMPAYAEVKPDTNRFAEPCWIYVLFPTFNGQLYITYKSLKNDLATYAEGSRSLVYKHTVKANGIEETVINTPNHVHGMLYDIGGNAASNLQFYVTDSVHHFIRGSMYFNVVPQSDSLAPVMQFLKEDIVHMINTLQWK